MKAPLPLSREALVQAAAAGEKYRYFFFWGHRKSPDGVVTKSCLSQWYDSPFKIANEVFPTAEHYMMVRKARLFGDEASAAAILRAPTPNIAKSLGRRVQGFTDELWHAHREDIVFTGNLAKFSQHPPFKHFLLETGNTILVEASPVDSIWGIGLAQDSESAEHPAAWRGLNLLGFALMKVRDQLQKAP